MPKCYFHIGFHKTATTSIQHYLRVNSDQLLKQGFIYPGLFMRGSNDQFFNHSLPFIVSIQGTQPHQAKVRDLEPSDDQKRFFIEQLKKLLETGKNLIFSGEGISKLREEHIKYINQLAIESGYQTEWVAVVRPPYSFLCSSLQQQIKEGARYFDFNKIKPEVIKVVTTTVAKLKAINGISIKFIPFNQLKKPESNIYREFAAQLSIKNLGNFKELKAKANDSIGNLQTRLQNICNKGNLRFHQGVRNPNYLDIQKMLEDFKATPNMFSDDKTKLINRINSDKSKFLLTKEEFSKVENGIKEDNQKLSTLLGPEFCESEFTFSEKLELHSLLSAL